MTTDKNFVELVKERCKIEDVISDEFTLKGHGRYRTTIKHDSLVIDIREQRYHWNSQSQSGDVINWVMTRQNCDFKTAVELLCRRANLPEPQWSKEDVSVRIAARQKEDVFEIAKRVFSRWLWKDPEALEYARSRGWTDDTIRLYELGYSGTKEKRKELTKELYSEISMYGGDPEGPAAVALLGLTDARTRLNGWSKEHGLTVPDDWAVQGYVPSLVARDMLIYPHVFYGRTVYFSGRGIHEKNHANLAVELAGPKRLYFNRVYFENTDETTIIEGQADAITLGQWGQSAVALAGVTVDENLREQIGRKSLYMGLDNDKAGRVAAGLEPRKPGQKQDWSRAFLLGPMTRLTAWGQKPYERFTDAHGAEKDVKDANDMLRSMDQRGVGFYREDDDEQVPEIKDMNAAQVYEWLVNRRQGEIVSNIKETAPTYAEIMAEWAAGQKGNARDQAMKLIAEFLATMDESSYSQYRAKLAKTLKCGVRELGNMVKAVTKSKESEAEHPIYTNGGVINGWVVEYLYDVVEDRASLAWKSPDGVIGKGDSLEIDGDTYLPMPPEPLFKVGWVAFPSAMGEKKSTRELVAIIEAYLRKAYIFPSERTYRLVAYWILSTYVYDCFGACIYLRAMGGAGSGKSEMCRRIGLLTYHTMIANGASSLSALFRSVNAYNGVVFIDEADLDASDTENDMVKFYNLGAMKGNFILRSEPVIGPDGEKRFVPMPYSTYCPKLVAMRKDFKDDAVGTRSLTLKLQPKEMIELKEAGISLTINAEMRQHALGIRNLLIRWRLENWQPEIEIDFDLYDLLISPRLNQVSGPMLALSKDDTQQQEDIRKTLREYYQESILVSNMGLSARVIEAMWKIKQYPDLAAEHTKIGQNGDLVMRLTDITAQANDIIKLMNNDDDDDDGKDGKTDKRRLRARRIGSIVREELQLQMTKRSNDGYWVVWNEARLRGLSVRFGVDPDEWKPRDAEEQPKQAAKVVQGKLA